MNLSVLEHRLLNEIPEEYHESIQKEIARFESEIERMSPEEQCIGQATLTEREVQKLNTTNQNGDDGLTVIQWQVCKAYAIHYGVTNWAEKVDGSLSKEENISLMESEGTKNAGTLRQMKDKIR